MTTPISRAAVLEILRTPQSWDTFPDMIRRVEALEGGGVRVLRGGNIVVVDGIGYPLHALVSAAFALVKETDNPGFNMPGWFYSGSPYAEQIKNLGVSPCGIPESFKPEYVPDLGAAWRKGPTSWEIYAKALEPVAQPETPTPGQFTTMCLAIEDVVTGRGFDVDPWQPIETAPKDGTEFDIWCVETHGRFRVPGCKWGRNDYAFSHEPERLLEYRAYDDEPYRSGWQDCERNATHWMPLPKPPGETTSAIPEEVKAYLRNVLMVGGWRGES